MVGIYNRGVAVKGGEELDIGDTPSTFLSFLGGTSPASKVLKWLKKMTLKVSEMRKNETNSLQLNNVGNPVFHIKNIIAVFFSV